jgi:hypothetical protein
VVPQSADRQNYFSRPELREWIDQWLRGTMTSTRAGIIIAATLVVTTTTAFAAAAPALGQWPRQCRSDISRICRDVMREEDRTVLTCLQENDKKLRSSCRKLLQSYGHVPEAPSKPARAKRRR